MKKIILSSILILILVTSIIKNSTKEIEDKIFAINENIRSLETELSNTMLEFNYLSSPEKLTEYLYQFFENDLVEINITKVKKLDPKEKTLVITDFTKKTQANE